LQPFKEFSGTYCESLNMLAYDYFSDKKAAKSEFNVFIAASLGRSLLESRKVTSAGKSVKFVLAGQSL
jgi:hypothetical protein